jgi:hypothetical protein
MLIFVFPELGLLRSIMVFWGSILADMRTCHGFDVEHSHSGMDWVIRMS